MAKGALIVGLVALALCLTGCTPTFSVSISGPLEAPVATVQPSGGLDRGPICLTAFSVSEYYSRSQGRELWSMRVEDQGADGRRCVELTSVTYGQAPAGFQALFPAEPLKADVPYIVHGVGPGLGSAIIVFSDGHWRSPFGLTGRRWVTASPEAD